MENIGKEPSIIHGTMHGPGYSGGNGITGLYTLSGGQRFADDFHTFAIEWEPNAVRFYVDGVVYQTKTPANLPAGGRWVFDHPFFMILNLAIGGNFPGPPDDTTTFPQTMMVDYVRVYVDANTLPAITDVQRKKKDLLVTGINFDNDAVILLNGEKQKTKRDDENPAVLIGKKLTKKIAAGQPVKLQIRNSDGLVSAEYGYTLP
jgi:beta-glucanase (GH16 family)